MAKRPSRGTHGLRSARFRNDDIVERKQPEGYDLHAPLSPEEFADLRAFADTFGDSPVVDKTMSRFRHLKRLEELGFIGREEDGSLRITPFGQKRIHHER